MTWIATYAEERASLKRERKIAKLNAREAKKQLRRLTKDEDGFAISPRTARERADAAAWTASRRRAAEQRADLKARGEAARKAEQERFAREHPVWGWISHRFWVMLGVDR